MKDVPKGIRAHEHVEGLTLLFREKHTATRRGVRRWGIVLVVSLVMSLLAVAASAILASLAAFTISGSALEGFIMAFLLGIYLVGLLAMVAAPTLMAAAAVGFGAVMYRDAGRTRVHLTVGVRGITVERKTEGQTTVFPPHDDLDVHVSTTTRYPTLVIAGSGRRVEIPVLGDTGSVEWLADRIRERCATAGNHANVPQALLEARRQ